MDHTLNYIIREVTTKPKSGITVINNFSGEREVDFETFTDIKAQGFDTVEAKLSDIISNTRNELTLYLKRKSGSSNVYRVDAAKEKFKVILKPLDNTNLEVSQNVVPVPAADSVGAATLNQQPTTPALIMQPNQQLQTGLMGYDPSVLDMYSKSTLAEPLGAKLELRDAEVKKQADTINEQRFEIIELKNKVAVLEATPKNIISDKAMEIGTPIIGQILEVLSAKSSAAALNGAAQQPAQEQFSPIKTALLGLIKDERFTDEFSQLFLDINNKGVDSPETLEQIKELAQTTQTT